MSETKRRGGAGRSLFKRLKRASRCIDLLGRLSDLEIARRIGCSNGAVRDERIRRGIPPLREAKRVAWTEERLAMLGKRPDAEVAALLGTSDRTVSIKRRILGIPSHGRSRGTVSRLWTPENLSLLGKSSDAEVARRIGTAASVVGVKRRILGILPFGGVPRRIDWTKGRLALLGKVTCSSQTGS